MQVRELRLARHFVVRRQPAFRPSRHTAAIGAGCSGPHGRARSRRDLLTRCRLGARVRAVSRSRSCWGSAGIRQRWALADSRPADSRSDFPLIAALKVGAGVRWGCISTVRGLLVSAVVWRIAVRAICALRRRRSVALSCVTLLRRGSLPHIRLLSRRCVFNGRLWGSPVSSPGLRPQPQEPQQSPAYEASATRRRPGSPPATR